MPSSSTCSTSQEPSTKPSTPHEAATHLTTDDLRLGILRRSRLDLELPVLAEDLAVDEYPSAVPQIADPVPMNR